MTCTVAVGHEHHVPIPCGREAVIVIDRPHGKLYVCSRHLSQDLYASMKAEGWTWSSVVRAA